MDKYPKIQTVYTRDPATRHKFLIEGQFATPAFEYLAGLDWVWTEKIDGCNARVLWQPDKEPSLLFKGRTDRAQFPTFLYSKLQEMFPVAKFEALYDFPLCLYGEGYGAKIQKGGGNYIADGVSFILFDVRVENLWLKREDVEDIATKLGLAVVPIVGQGSLQKAVGLVHRGFTSRIGTQVAEGLVMRPAVELLDRRGNRIITKIKHKDFPR